tara:strand:+ start:9886 stop:10164 length:279 start_codon:yes stop_codon:yes gene_type:complete
MKSVKPVGKKLLVKPVKIETKTASGIYLPEQQQLQKPQGHVVACGRECSGEIKVGDFIQWPMTNNDEYEFDHQGEKHLIISEGYVIAILEDV